LIDLEKDTNFHGGKNPFSMVVNITTNKKGIRFRCMKMGWTMGHGR